MGREEHILAPGPQEIAVLIQDNHRVLAAIKREEVVVGVDGDACNFLVEPSIGQVAPLVPCYIVCELSFSKSYHVCLR